MFSSDKLKKIFRSFGFEVKRTQLGIDPYQDIITITGGRDLNIIDAGANEGQSALRLNEWYPNSRVYSFEPMGKTFEILKTNLANHENLIPFHKGLGAADEELEINITAQSVMNSFLEYDNPEHPWWKKGTEKVQVTSLDTFAEEQGLTHIDLLKIDTQGFDLEVIKGAEKLIEAGRVHLIKPELLFVELYKQQASFQDIYAYLIEKGFRLTGLYGLDHEGSQQIHWCDGLFVYPDFKRPG